MVMLLNEALTGSLAIVEMLAILAVLKIKLLRKAKPQQSLVKREEENLPSTKIDPTTIVKIARYLLEIKNPISSNLNEWETYRLCLQENLENYLHSGPRLPNLSAIETTESYLEALMTIVKKMLSIAEQAQ